MNSSDEMVLEELLKKAFSSKASDIHLMVGRIPTLRIDGELKRLTGEIIDEHKMLRVIDIALKDRKDLLNQLERDGQIDFSYEKQGVGRARVNIYRQQGNYAVAIRLINNQMPTMDELGLPVSILENLLENRSGLILVTGATGSGKTSTLASMLDYINHTKYNHLLTLEDPIEYIHSPKQSIISQREIGLDTCTYAAGLKAVLREDPDVILVGEMRDLETISTAITAAETGHLVLSSLHTMGAAQTVNRIVDVFPGNQQQYIRSQLSEVLRAVISQQLLPRKGKEGRIAVLEIMINNYAISNMIREGKNHQIDSQIQTGSATGMIAMDDSIIKAYRQGEISKETACQYAQNKQELIRKITR